MARLVAPASPCLRVACQGPTSASALDLPCPSYWRPVKEPLLLFRLAPRQLALLGAPFRLSPTQPIRPPPYRCQERPNRNSHSQYGRHHSEVRGMERSGILAQRHHVSCHRASQSEHFFWCNLRSTDDGGVLRQYQLCQ